MSKKSLQKERIVYKPFEYPEAFDFYMKQQQAHWLWTEVPMMADVNDWKQNLSPKTQTNKFDTDVDKFDKELLRKKFFELEQ